MRNPLKRRFKRIWGVITLIDVMGTATLSAAALISAAYYTQQQANETRVELLTNYLSEFNQGATRFINENYSQFFAGGTYDVITPGHKTFSVANISAFLPTNFSNTSPVFNATPQLLIVKQGSQQLQAWTYTTGIGTFPGDTTLAELADAPNKIGGSTAVIRGTINGQLPTLSGTTVAISTAGDWQMNQAQLNAFNASMGSAITPNNFVTLLDVSAAEVGPQSPTHDLLFPDSVRGHPELNQMATDLNMGNNNLASVSTVNATTGVFAGNVSSNSTTVGQTASANLFSATGNVTANSSTNIANSSSYAPNGSCTGADGTLVRSDTYGMLQCAGGVWKTFQTKSCQICTEMSGLASCATVNGTSQNGPQQMAAGAFPNYVTLPTEVDNGQYAANGWVNCGNEQGWQYWFFGMHWGAREWDDCLVPQSKNLVYGYRIYMKCT